MARRKAHRALPTPEEVLQGHRSVGVAELVRLIHRVNPTDRGLPEQERDERYRVKSRLQSLLLRAHRPLVVVEGAADGDEDLVLLRLRSGGRDAGHALVSRLDEDLRPWVREQLCQVCLQPGSNEPARPVAERREAGAAGCAGKGSLLERGRSALEAYDYELARELLERAVRQSPSDPEAAATLLELLMDHLAAWQDALAIGALLLPPASEHPRVLEPLARAAIRTGDVEGALRRARTLDDERLAPVLVLVCDHQLREGEPDAAQASLQRLRAADPLHPAILRLDAALADLRARTREPEEDALECLYAEERWDDLVAAAQALLVRWPGSIRARRLLSLGEARLQEWAREGALTRLRRALELDDLPEAERRLRQLDELGGAPEDLVQRVRQAREARRLEALRSQAQALRERLGEEAERPAALLVYLQLSAEARALVRAGLPYPEPGWVEELAPPSRGGRAARAVEGVVALAAAAQAHREGEHRRAQELLDGCWDAVVGLDAAKRLRGQVREVLQRQQRRALQELSRDVEAALAGDAPRAAMELLDAFAEGPLHPVDEPALRGLRERARARLARDVAIAEARKFADERCWVELRAQLEARPRDAAEGLPEDLQALLEGLEGRVREQFCVAVATNPELGLSDWNPPRMDIDRCDTVLPGGRSLLAVRCLEGWLVLREVDIDSQRVLRLVVLRPPGAFVLVDSQLSPEGLWCFGTRGEQLLVDPCEGAIREWHSPFGAADDELPVSAAVLVPGSRCLWLRREGSRKIDDFREQIQVTRVGDRRVRKELGSGYTFVVIEGPEPARVAVLDLDEGLRVFLPRGTPDTSMRAGRGLKVEAVEWLGEDQGWLFLRRGFLPEHALAEAADDEDLGEALVLDHVGRGGAILGSYGIGGSDADMASGLLTARHPGRVYVICRKEGMTTLLALAVPRQGRFEKLWETRVANGASLAWDRDRRHVLLTWSNAGGPCWLALGLDEPEIPPQDRVEAHWLLGHVVSLYCAFRPNRAPTTRVQAAIDALTARSDSQIATLVTEFEQRHGDDADALDGLVDAMRHGRSHRFAMDLLRRAWERHPRHGMLALRQAHELAQGRAWREVLEVLGAAGSDSLGPSALAHRHHLLGVAWLYAGDTAKAREALHLAGTIDGSACTVDVPLAFCDVLDHGLDARLPSSLGVEMVTFVSAVREADRHLDVGAWAGAIAALDHSLLWQREERQTAARRAWAWLQLEPHDPGQRAAKLIALGSLVERTLGRYGDIALDLPVPPHTWDSERIAAVAREARAWVERVRLAP